SAAIDDEQERPPIQKCRQRSECFGQIDVTTTSLRSAGSQLREVKRADERDGAADDPGGENERRGVYALGDNCGVEKYTGTTEVRFCPWPSTVAPTSRSRPDQTLR